MAYDGDNKNLPAGLSRPRSLHIVQSTLFPESVDSVLAQLRVSPNELNEWHAKGWVSFDAQTTEKLEPHHQGEVLFVRDVLRQGLPTAWIENLLGQLPRPMNFDPHRIAYSFTYGWVVADEAPVADMEDAFDEWLEAKANDEDIDELKAAHERISALLGQMEGE